MRQVLAAAATLAALAITAAPAAAQKIEPPNPHQFVGSQNIEPRFSGESVELELKPFVIECELAKSTPSGVTPTFPSKTLTALVKFTKCEAEGKVGKGEYEFTAKFSEPVKFVYHANGAVEMGAAEITLKGPFKCAISILPGTYPPAAVKKPEAEYEAAKYTNKEETIEKGKTTSVVKKLGIATALSKVHYELEGEVCEQQLKTENTGGIVEDSLVAEIKKGSLSWE